MHIQACAALGCISQSWMLSAAIGWAMKRAVYCAVRGWQGALYLLCALSFNLCSQQNKWLSRVAQPPRLQHPADDSAPWRRGREKRTSVGEKRVDPQMKRDWKGMRSTEGVRGVNERTWVNTAVCLRTTAAVLNLGLSGKPSAKEQVREAREQRRKRSDLKSWFHHSGQAGMATPRASPSADQTSHRKSAFG